MIQTQVYDVPVKPVKMTIVEEQSHKYAEDGKIVVGNKVRVTEATDSRNIPESMPDGKIKPFGLDADDGAYDVEVRERVEDKVVQEHIDAAIEAETPKPAKRTKKNGVQH